MPIEIRELVIKAVVEPEGGDTSTPSQESEKNEDKIIERSVEQTLKILEKKQER
ncbi:MAG: DUF5908 family protein [Balneolaceae bacterium]|nr:DUF5908 family protein [Balneolaceae bacterium]